MLTDNIITFLASFLIFILFLGLFILWVIDGRIKKEQVIHAIFAIFITWVISEVIKTFFPTVRPYLINGQEALTITTRNDGAFPSFHTMSAFALSITIFLHDRKIGFWFLIGALLVGIGRVLANVHYPVDVIGGAFLGTLTAVMVDKTHFSRLFDRKKKP